MTIAEQLAEKWVAEDRDPWAFTEDAINEALELAAQEAEKVAKQNDADAEQGWYQQNNWLAETAARIRALKVRG